MHGLRLFGAAGGAIFAIVTVVAYAIAPGPSSDRGDIVLEYYAAHGTATLWQASLAAFAAVFFIWFAETFAGQVSSGPVAIVGAAVTAALYLVTIGCWEVIGEIYGGVDVNTVTSEDYSDAHVFYVVGTGAAHLAHFTAAAYIGSAAAAMLESAMSWRWLAWIGVGLALVLLVSAEVGLASHSDWSNVVGAVAFLGWLAWIFAASVWLVLALRRGAVAEPAEGRADDGILPA